MGPFHMGGFMGLGMVFMALFALLVLVLLVLLIMWLVRRMR